MVDVELLEEAKCGTAKKELQERNDEETAVRTNLERMMVKLKA